MRMLGNSNESDLVIQTEQLTRVFGVGNVEVQALRGVSIRLRYGEFVALMGASGSGKSTLMHLLGCLDSPTSGKYFLEGQDVSELSDNQRSTLRSRCLGVIFQSFNLLPRLTALENVLLPLMYQGQVDAVRQRAQEALDRVGLSHRIHHAPAEMSGGEKQRVAIARALIVDPVLILADEPTGNLDSVTGQEILEILASLNAGGRTILMVTHNEVAASYAKRILTMEDGRIVQREFHYDLR
jgi:putative ABC transport system ATP-binding protein